MTVTPKRFAAAIAFFCIVVIATLVGAQLDGNLYRIEPGKRPRITLTPTLTLTLTLILTLIL